jgi:hypothetical protein
MRWAIVVRSAFISAAEVAPDLQYHTESCHPALLFQELPSAQTPNFAA